jgi:hypothetical protein
MFVSSRIIPRLSSSKSKVRYLSTSAEILDEEKSKGFQRETERENNFQQIFSPSREMLEIGVKNSRKDRAFSECGEWI